MQDQDEVLSSSSIVSEQCMDQEPDPNLPAVIFNDYDEDEYDDDDDNESDRDGDDVGVDDDCNDETKSYETAYDIANDKFKSFPHDTVQISIALALFRHRHRLSKSCVNDLCELLRYLGVQKVPTDFRSIERNILRNQENVLQSQKHIVCSKCGNKGKNTTKCENMQCKSSTGFDSTPTTLCTFRLLPQITSILERQTVLPEPDNDTSTIADIQEGEIRRNIASQELINNPKKQIITLLLNSDGVVIKKISRSIWVICMVINELPRSVRFNINNIIICSMSIGCTKPKKNMFQSFIADWVHELRQLELGFHIASPNTNNQYVRMHAYLIAAAMDKPAQSLLLNINDPVGFYSCVRCTIKGKTVQSGNGTIRAFIKNTEDNIEDRSNALYDKHVFMLSKRKSKRKTNERDPACGQQGTCLLRDLSYFSIDRSFTADSLHNVYAGTFKRLLELWFKTRRQPFSIHKCLHLIEIKLNAIRYPSTTYHLPSQLRHFQTYKGNEFRLTLLFGYQYFEPFLPVKYYKHLKLLAHAMSLSESYILDVDTIEKVELLLNEFDRLFPLLYSENSMTSVAHSMVHVSQTLRDFGPVQHYSTFNFESVVGSLVQSINGPNLIVSELINNINLLKCATAQLNRLNYRTSLHMFIHRLFSSKRQALPKEEFIKQNNSIRVGRKLILSNDHMAMVYLREKRAFNFSLHRTCWKNNIQFSVYEPNSTGKNCDSFVLFKDKQERNCGFITAIIYDSLKQCYVMIHTVRVDRRDSLIIKKKYVINPFIFWGELTDPPNLVTIHIDNIIIKLAHSKQDIFHFFQFPNSIEST